MKLKMDPFHKAKGRIPEMMGHWGLENKRDHTRLPSVSTCHTLPPKQQPCSRRGFLERAVQVYWCHRLGWVGCARV